MWRGVLHWPGGWTRCFQGSDPGWTFWALARPRLSSEKCPLILAAELIGLSLVLGLRADQILYRDFTALVLERSL